MLVIKARDAACPWCYKLSAWFDSSSGFVIFRHTDKILDLLMYFGSYNLAPRMGIDSVIMYFAIYWCTEIDWKKTALQHGIFLYNSESGEVYDLEEEIVQANKLFCSASVALTSLTLQVISILYQARVSRVTLESVQRSYDEYRGVGDDPNEASGETGAK